MVFGIKFGNKEKHEENEMDKTTEIWEDFGITEKEYNKYTKEFKHANIDYDETWTELINHLYDDPKHKVFAIQMFFRGCEQGELMKEQEWEDSE